VLAPGASVVVCVTVDIVDEPGPATDVALVSARSDLDGGTRTFATVTTERRIRGDLNGDGVVDATDFAAFIGCLIGPDVGVAGDCEASDLDLDFDADMPDAALFQRNFATGT
jgi:hypothetical protein